MVSSNTTMSRQLTEADVREALGDIEERAREMESFSRGARIFVAHQERITDAYDERWIAIHEDDVAAENIVAADSPAELTATLERLGIREGECFVRLVHRPRETLFL